jgi:hypothetical protein
MHRKACKPKPLNKTAISFCIIILLLSTVLFFNESQHKAIPLLLEKKTLLPDITHLQSGDLVLRHGKGFISKLFLQFSQTDPQYSHAGVLSIENGQAWVYHAIGGEENQGGALRKELLLNFCNPHDNFGYGLFRYELSPVEKIRLVAFAKRCYLHKLPFDTAMDLQTDNKMYCSEFIYKMLKNALPEKNIIPLSVISGRSYVAIDNLYMNPYCKAVYKQVY